MQQLIDNLAQQIQTKERFTAVGISVGHRNNSVKVAVSGIRQHQSSIPVQLTDKWHIGSITKSITATIIGKVAENGALEFDSTLSDLLPNVSMHAQWAECSLEHLLTHTSGLPANFPWEAQKVDPPDSSDLVFARRKLIEQTLSTPPKTACGSKFLYSNVGYAVIGHIIEAQADSVYEKLVKDMFFEPCGFESAGFGPPMGSETDDQPMGHQSLLWYRKAVNPFEGRADNGPAISAAGRVHMNLQDLNAYGRMHLDGELGTGNFLKSETWQRLHKPVTNDYAYGWSVSQSLAGQSPVIWHNGSNTLWYALLLLSPEKNTVLAFVTNVGKVQKAEKAFIEAAKQIFDKLE